MTVTRTEPTKPPVITVTGPTATGKSDLAVGLARHFDGEIVNADSMQLYVGMDVGTAKLLPAERAGITHHLLDIWPLGKSASVSDYQLLARQTIDEIRSRGVVPILVGGSGLYIRGVMDRLEFPGESPPIRARLAAEAERIGPHALHARLAAVDPAAAASILPGNARRVVRALEVIELTGKPFTATMPAFESIYPSVHLGLDRPDLAERVRLRVTRMVELGLLDEVRRLLPLGLRTSPTAARALGYHQLLAVLDDDGTLIGDLDAALELTALGTLRFVRRQRSWFRRDPRIRWLDGAAPDVLDLAVAAVSSTMQA